MEATPFRDRRGGLIFFGILHILLGLLAVLVILLTIAAVEIARRRGEVVAPQASLGPNLLIYAIFAVYAFSVGVGSIRGRRWARAMALAVSWIWLVSGVLSAVMLIVIMPQVMVLVPPSASAIVVAVTATVVLLFYIVLPAAFILFYRRSDVRATCEARDPRPRWTDRVPVPVLAISLVLAFGAIVLIGNIGRSVVPILGVTLTGPAATLTLVALAALLAWLSLQLYRLKESAWWTLILLQIIGGIVALMTLLRTDINALYERMGLMTPQLRSLHLEQVFRQPLLWTVLGIAWTDYLAFLIWLRRYFGRPSS
jgi:hypothetical protein